jgi:hypothetical protein
MAKNTERNYQIKLNAAQNTHLEFEGWSTKRLMNEIIKLRKQNALLEDKLTHINDEAGFKMDSTLPKYNQKWTYPQKLCFILYQAQQPLPSSQLYDALFKADNHFENFRDPLSILNSYLGRMTKSGRLIAHKLPGVRKHFYVLPDWLGADAKLKPEYAAYLNFLS